MVESTLTKVTQLSGFDDNVWHGIPSLFALGETKIGALHPEVIVFERRILPNYRIEVNVMFTVCSWVNGYLQRLVSIVLRRYLTPRHAWQSMCLHYDETRDTVLIAEGDVT